jgi:hypothetical protein
MAAAALTPRVRILAVCDEATASATENGAYTLEGVRQGVVAAAFPCRRDFSVFLLLSCPRRGSFAGWVRVSDLTRDKTVRLEKFHVRIQEDNGLVSLVVNAENCVFPMPGEYAFEVWISVPNGQFAQKGELLFHVHEFEE